MKQKNDTKTIIAIDPGKSGAIAIFYRGKISSVCLKDYAGSEIVSFFKPFAAERLENGVSSAVAYMEKVGGYIPTPEGEGQPGSRMFVFGCAYGFVMGVLRALDIETRLVLPQVWQRGIPGRKGTYNDRKKALHAHAKRLFPQLDIRREEADALGILHYALFQEGISNTGYETPLVANPDDSAAVKWCKAQGWTVPSYGTAEYAQMVRYWAQNVKGAA